MEKTIKISKSTLSYSAETGVFTWVEAYRKPSLTGAVAARAMPNGYLYIKTGGKQISASRLAWELIYGKIANGLEIDHINRNKQDNRIENLRVVTRAENLANRAFKPNACNATGVSLHKRSGLFRARYKNKTAYARTIEEASRVYARFKEQNA